MAEETKTKKENGGRGKKIILGIVGIIFLFTFLRIVSGEEKEKPKLTPIEKKEEGIIPSRNNEENLSISKDRFSYYNETCLKLIELQNEYEQEYTKLGAVGLEAAKAIPEDAEFPKYGSIMREIASIFHSLPKFNTNMSPGERHLVFKIADYGSSLIFMTPKEDAIEGMDYVLESKEALEDALKKVKDFNGF